MTDEEKKAIVDAVIAQLKSEGTDVSSTAIVEDVGDVATVICYDASGNIVRIAPLALNAQESANAEAIAAEIERATSAESANAASIDNINDTIGAISDALSNETTARQNADTELTDNQVRTWGVSASTDGVNLLGKNNSGANVHSIDIPSATTEKAGVMTAEDKVALDTATSRALRALFVSAGAEYNDTDTDITKTAPWGESVTHKAGRYYLNGLGDITEEQMMAIYRVHPSRVYGGATLTDYIPIPVRTIFPASTNVNVHTQYNAINSRNIATGNYALEILFLSAAIEKPVCISNFSYAFYGCSKLIHIANVIDVDGINTNGGLSFAFFRCEKLTTVKLKNLKTNVSFSEALLISKDSMLYIVQNSNPTSAITITLHPDAFARLANDADIVAALEAQPLVTLASA